MDKFTKMLMVAAVLVAAFFVFKILQKLEIIDTLEDKRNASKAESFTTDELFNPSTYSTVKSFRRMTVPEIKIFAKKIRKAVYGWGTDEELLFSTFANMYNRLNISQIAEYYQNEYGDDMRAELLKDLSEEDQAKLIDIIYKLPKK